MIRVSNVLPYIVVHNVINNRVLSILFDTYKLIVSLY